MRDPAGQLPDRLQVLGLAQRAFGGLAPFGFLMQPAGALQREPEDGEQKKGRRQAEDQVAGHRGEPFGAIADSSMPATA